MRRLKAAWHWLNLPCREHARLASEALDRDLSRLERWSLRLHLLTCRACRRYARQLLILRRALRRVTGLLEEGGILAGPGLPPEVRERIRRSLENR